MLRISNIKMSLSAPLAELPAMVARLIGAKLPFAEFQVVKQAVDARSRREVFFTYTVDVKATEEAALLAAKNWPYLEQVTPIAALKIAKVETSAPLRPLIVGSGPAGMLAGLALAEAGLNPIIIERGREVSRRQADVQHFWNGGELRADSNVQFGEGGAGTFSDGKLMTGIKKDSYTAKVFAELVAAGAPEEILYQAKPHLGTDQLAGIVQKIRAKIIALGGEYRFEQRLSGLIIKDDKLVAAQIELTSGAEAYEQPLSHLILAIGHSARDTFEMLYASGVPLEPKAFSVGARIEHLQSSIDQALYHDFAGCPQLGAADYKLAVHLPNGRSAYTFCMCPGGAVVAAASELGHLVTNGMSYYARDLTNANSALLVGITPADFGGNHPLQGMYFQRQLEQKAFVAGGKTYSAPAQLVGDLLKSKPSTAYGAVVPSYSRGVVMTSLDTVLPTYVTDTLRLALVEMDKKLSGFAHPQAILTGVETRSSSPVRLIRNENAESPIVGLFPCGEGAGYAGGIVSAAVDGLKTALHIIESLNK